MMKKYLLVIMAVTSIVFLCVGCYGYNASVGFPYHVSWKISDHHIVELLNENGCFGVVVTHGEDSEIIKIIADGYAGFSTFLCLASATEFYCGWNKQAIRFYAVPSSKPPEEVTWEDCTQQCSVNRSDLYFPFWVLVVVFGFLPVVCFYRGPVLRYYRGVHGYCKECGYNLKGSQSGRCPECGTSITDSIQTNVDEMDMP